MSRVLESESDNDDSGQSTYASSLNDLSKVQPPKLSREQTTGSINTSYLVQNKLEQFSRRLSMLGLASSQEDDEQISQAKDSDYNGPTYDSNESIKTTQSGSIETDGIVVPKQKIPMTTSLILKKLPKATEVAIERIQREEGEADKSPDKIKVQVKFQPIGSIPQITPSVCRISAVQPFSLILSFLLKKLKIQHVYCYINNSFAPNPQQTVGDLWSQFKVDDALIIGYCGSVAFG
ncbi:hypothetical protein HG535_0G02040 [Zygotorulaspora mrakii]|uniref:Ubiquitin-like protein ATG12 n=1 Tax=Zygotorulaspora mrakii TaxID=42260 RepID=A0A7H9B705_ZYGMR|nr:uncharacterized protein HG535_0G02040 [Zygotorulaspora mrakii]QLG74320.1 hypothetical protein HG535_0G02040 [Zygotorulaspora mrakii]